MQLSVPVADGIPMQSSPPADAPDRIRDLRVGLTVLTISALLTIALTTPPSGSVPAVHTVLYMFTVGLLLYLGFFNFILPLIGTVLVIRGMMNNRPGLVAAPFVFLALWIAASVASRVYVLYSYPGLSSREIPAALRTVRTLTIENASSVECCGNVTLLSEGVIDQLVLANKIEGKTRIMSSRLARGSTCTGTDFKASALLAEAGRTDECIQTEEIEAIPDGLVISIDSSSAPVDLGCCTEGIVSQRLNGKQVVAATWHHGIGRALAYLPMFGPGSPGKAGGIWSFGSAEVVQRVQIGGPEFSHRDLAVAIYGIDWRALPAKAQISTAELSRRALSFAQKTDLLERRPALDMALALQKRQATDSQILALVASYIDATYLKIEAGKVSQFWQGLSREQKREFLALVLDRLRIPAQGRDHGLESVFPGDLRADFHEAAEQAERIFAEQSDLKSWQYEFALRMAYDDRLLYGSPEKLSEQQRIFAMLRGGKPADLANRALAFKTVYRISTDEERDFFAGRLDDVPDELLEQYVKKTGWYGSGTGRAVSQAIVDFRNKAIARVARIPDETARKKIHLPPNYGN